MPSPCATSAPDSTEATTSSDTAQVPSSGWLERREALPSVATPPSVTHVPTPVLPSTRLFLDLFAGAASPVSSHIARLGGARLEPIDVLVGPAHDLLNDSTFWNLQRLCSSGLVGAAAAAPRARPSRAPDSVRAARHRSAPSNTPWASPTLLPLRLQSLKLLLFYTPAHVSCYTWSHVVGVLSGLRILLPACFGWTQRSLLGAASLLHMRLRSLHARSV